MRVLLTIILLTLTLQTIKGQGWVPPVGVQAILKVYPRMKYLGTIVDSNTENYWAFYDSQDPKDENRVYVTVPEGSTPQEFKEAYATVNTATLNWIVEQKTPNWESQVSKRDEDEELPSVAQAKIAMDANLDLTGYATISAVGVYHSKKYHDTTWVFYCKSLVSELPNILLWTPPEIPLKRFHQLYRTAIAAVVELKSRHPNGK
jgi:hypothetical protein